MRVESAQVAGQLAMSELIQTAATDEMIEEHNKAFAYGARRSHNRRQEILRTMTTEPAELTLAYKFLLTRYLDKHTEKGEIQTDEEVRDYLDVIHAHKKARKLAKEFGPTHRGITGEIYLSGVSRDVLARVMGEDAASADVAARIAAEKVHELPDWSKKETKKGFMKELEIPTADMIAFVGRNIPEEILGFQDAITRGNLRIAREFLEYKPDEVEGKLPNYLMRVVRGTAAPDLLLPAVRSYFSKEYPGGLIADTKRRPDYAGATTDMLMITLKDMKGTDKNAGMIYDTLLEQAQRSSRSGRVNVRTSNKANDALRPPVSALVGLANKLGSSLARATGEAYEPITSDSGDLQFTKAISRITEALLFTTKNPNFTLDAAELAVSRLECVDLMNGRLSQYLHAKAKLK